MASPFSITDANAEMGKHPDYVVHWPASLEELAQAVGNMTYDKVVEFLGCLEADLKQQAEGDRGRNRHKLAQKLETAAVCLGEAKEEMQMAWDICEPYMDKPRENRPTAY